MRKFNYFSKPYNNWFRRKIFKIGSLIFRLIIIVGNFIIFIIIDSFFILINIKIYCRSKIRDNKFKRIFINIIFRNKIIGVSKVLLYIKIIKIIRLRSEIFFCKKIIYGNNKLVPELYYLIIYRFFILKSRRYSGL